MAQQADSNTMHDVVSTYMWSQCMCLLLGPGREANQINVTVSIYHGFKDRLILDVVKDQYYQHLKAGCIAISPGST